MGIVCAALLVFSVIPQRPSIDPTFGMPIPNLASTAARHQKDAEWIWASTVSDTQTVYCRHALSLTAPPKRAILYVTADNYFHAFVNDREVGSSHQDASDNLVWAKVQKYDVTALLSAGGNEIAVQAINAGGSAGMLLRLEIDGKPALLSDGTWRVTDADASARWTNTDFNDSMWQKATVEANVGEGVWGGQLSGWPVQLNSAAPYLAHLKLSPKLVALSYDNAQWKTTGENVRIAKPADANGPWKAIFDFGKELTGRVAISSDGYLKVKVGTGESAQEAFEKPYTSADLELSSKPGYTPYTALRYAVVTLPAEVKVAKFHVSMDHLYYPVTYLGSFDCSDPLFTKIWYTGAYTAHLCMQEDIWDAPKRDRARWMGDLHISGEVINNVFLDKFLMEQTMTRLRADAQGGKPEASMPNGNVNGIPGYSCAWIAGLADFQRHVGDTEYLKKQRRALITMLQFLRTELGADGLFANNHKQWPYVDWAPQFNGDTPQARAATHLFFVKAAHEAVFLFEQMGDSANAARYKTWANELTRTAQEHLLSSSGTFGDRRQENAMAIYSGVATSSQIPTIYHEVLKPGTPAWNFVASPYYNNYVLDAMTQSGHMEDAMGFVKNFWGGMLAEGATSWWEGYDPSWEKTNFHSHLQADDGTGFFVSLSHGWSAGPTNWLTERVLGVKSTGSGFSTFTIEPNLGSLAWVSGNVPTPHGIIKVRVDHKGKRYRIKTTTPEGITGHIGSQVVKPGEQSFEIEAPVDAR